MTKSETKKHLTRSQIEEKEQELSNLLEERKEHLWPFRDRTCIGGDSIRKVDSLNARIEVLAKELKPWLESLQS